MARWRHQRAEQQGVCTKKALDIRKGGGGANDAAVPGLPEGAGRTDGR